MDDVYVKSGEQPRAFAFGNPAAFTLSTITNQDSLPIYKESPWGTFQGIISGIGALTGSLTIQVTNDDNTGRGFIPPGKDAPGFPVGLTSGSPTMTSAAGNFTQALVGALISAPNVPVGTTVSSVTNPNTLTMSANASATSANQQAWLYAQNWCATPLSAVFPLPTTSGSDGFATLAAPWRYVRARITALTGTGAAVSVLMGV